MKSLNKIFEYTIITLDGYRAQIKDILFDPASRKVKFFNADFGSILTSELMLISKEYVREFNHEKEEILLQVPKIKASAPLEQNEISNAEHKSASLLNFQEIKGFHIYCNNEPAGVIDDLYSDNAWNIIYAIIDTNTWNPLNKKTIIETQLFENFNLIARQISLPISKEALKEAPTIDASKLDDKQYQQAIHDYYASSVH